MPLELQVQINIIIYGILSGLITGILFDFYRLIRGVNIPIIIKVVEDILFCILTAIIIFIFLLFKNYAFLGPYVYLFIGISLVLYFRFISSKVIKVEKYLGELIFVVIRRLWKIVIYPFKLLLSKMGIKNR